ncbi:MAG: efflux RND transporter periplasmic adaptor subunit [Spirochaetales bacterium]|nr:efflux RND transporter periplasmic adaptor subunit [Spirochaetales bacterium]
MRHVLFCFLVVSILIFGACSATDEKKSEAELRPVRFVVVEEESPSSTRGFSGITSAEDELPIAFRVAGQIQEITVNPGVKVSQGQLLARLYNEEFQLEVERAEASLESAKVQYRTAESAYRRTRELYQNDSASRNQLETSQSNLESIQSNLVSAEAQLERVRLQLSYTEVRAPFSGTVANRYIDEGAVVGAGQAILALSGEEINRVKITVPEDIVSRISEGMKASISVDAAGLIDVPGEIIEVSSGSAQQGSLFPVEIEIIGVSSSQLRSGMAASVDIELATGNESRFIVPPHAVLEDEKGRHVFVVNHNGDSTPATGTVERRAVEISELTDSGLSIVSGLQSGDRVITAGMSLLSDGMIVRSPQ